MPDSAQRADEATRFSIITVVRNGRETLERTFQSVVSQTYSNYEYIVIDGGSADGTQGLIQQYEGKIAHWISEPDRGIYDAMNKGMAAATGDYLWFLNSGDAIHSTDTLELLARQATDRPEIIYGDYVLYYAETGKQKYLKAPLLSWKGLSNGMIVSHQAVLCRRDRCVPYDLRYRVVSDLDWLIAVTHRSTSISYSQIPMALYLAGGFSDRQFTKGWFERLQIIQSRFGWLALPKNLAQFGLARTKRTIKALLRLG